MRFVVLSDFDGTAVNVDTCQFILQRYAKPGWRALDKQYEMGEITLEETMQEQFSLIGVSKRQILDEVGQVASFRLGFEKLVDYCSQEKVPLILVSAGLDFVINHLLQRKHWEGKVSIYSPKAIFSANGIKFVFPTILDETSANFKEDLVKRYKMQDKMVVYIGDGVSDFYGAKASDLRFAIKGSKLESLLKSNGVSFLETTDFKEVMEVLKQSLRTSGF